MSEKAKKITGWVLTGILALLFGFSAIMKFSQTDEALSQAASMGFDAATIKFIGVLELSLLVLFIIPRTGVIGTLFLAAYMGGAIATHLQHGQPMGMAIAVETIVWVAAMLRFPELLYRILGIQKHPSYSTKK